jgi:hypothetical protein
MQYIVCPQCHGPGTISLNGTTTICSRCGGTGAIQDPDEPPEQASPSWSSSMPSGGSSRQPPLFAWILSILGTLLAAIALWAVLAGRLALIQISNANSNSNGNTNVLITGATGTAAANESGTPMMATPTSSVAVGQTPSPNSTPLPGRTPTPNALPSQTPTSMPVLNVSPASFSALLCVNKSVTVTVTNTGDGTLQWSATSALYAITPSSGSLGAGVGIPVTISKISLGDQATFTSNGGSQTVSIACL